METTMVNNEKNIVCATPKKYRVRHSEKIPCAPLPTNTVCATPKKYRVRHSRKISCAPLPQKIRGPIWRPDFPRVSKIMDFNETHYSVRQKIGDPGSISIRNMFPLHSVTSKRPESPYGATFVFLPKIPPREPGQLGPKKTTTKNQKHWDPI